MRKGYYKTLGTSVITSPVSPPSLEIKRLKSHNRSNEAILILTIQPGGRGHGAAYHTSPQSFDTVI